MDLGRTDGPLFEQVSTIRSYLPGSVIVKGQRRVVNGGQTPVVKERGVSDVLLFLGVDVHGSDS